MLSSRRIGANLIGIRRSGISFKLIHTQVDSIKLAVSQQATLLNEDLSKSYDPSFPVEAFQTALQTVHNELGVTWVASLLLIASAFRICTFPLFKSSLIMGWRRSEAAVSLKDIREMAREAVLLRDKNLVLDIDREYKARLHALGLTTNPFAGMGYLLIAQMPWTCTMMFAMRGMSTRLDCFPSFILGSEFLWCESLALSDPFGILPSISAMYIALMTYQSSSIASNDTGKSINLLYMRYAIRAASFIFMPFAMHLPSGMIVFFIFNSVFSRCAAWSIKQLRIPTSKIL